MSRLLVKTLIIYLFGTALLAGTTTAAIFYVDGSVAASGDGSQAAPFKTIGEAIAAASFGDEIRIAGGVYENEQPDRAIKGQQVIRGSYNSTFTISDPLATPTIIDMGRLSEQQQDRTFRCNGVTSFVIENLIIRNSTSGEFGNTDNGGAIYIQGGSSGVIRGVWFINCASRFEGGVESGPARDGGAVCIRDASVVTFEDCVFDGCTAVGRGGAICMRSGGAGNNVTIRRCLFTNCGSRNGASSIHDTDGTSQVAIVNSLFINNGVDVAVPSGIAPSNYEISVADRTALIYNCTFVGNNCPDGFMLDIRDSSNAAATKEFVNCIFANNNIAGGGAVFTIFAYASGYNDKTVLKNNLFFSNSDAQPLDPSATRIIGIDGNIEADPLFVDPANGDYHLNEGSPGIDAGLPLELVPNDFAGVKRPIGAGYDIGALEGQPVPPSYVVQNITATASSSLNPESGPEKTIDGSGLNEFDQHDTKATNMWACAIGQQPPVWIQYEFDKVYKLDQMWVWNSNTDLEWLVGWGVKTAIVEYSVDGITWTAVPNVPEFGRGTSKPDYQHNTTIDLDRVAARFVRMTLTSSWSGTGQYGLSEVRFFYIPVWPQNPRPADGATGVPADTTLTWKPGKEAALHQIYLGTDMQAVADGTTPTATVTEPMYAPSNLQLDTTYYWKVVEVNQAQSPTSWAGDIWRFTTSPYMVVDDFEGYTNNSPNRVFQTWIDGLGFSADSFFPAGNSGNGTGAIVGYDPAFGPIMERSIVHSGKQSIPFSYKGLSETTRTFSVPQDWTLHGIKTLVLFFYGQQTNLPGELYVKINGTKISYPGSASDLTAEQWIQWNIDLPAAGLNSVKALTIGVSSGQGMLLIDDIRLYRNPPAANP